MSNNGNYPIKSMAYMPDLADVARSRQTVQEWFERTAPLIQWAALDSPVGPLFFAATSAGVCRVSFVGDEDRFLAMLDPLARTERSEASLRRVADQLAEYFNGGRRIFDLPLDWSGIHPFQRSVLETALRIAPGTVWTYHQVAQAIGRPKASRAVGQALGANPIPVVIPCHRVIASDGNLRGYAGGLERKRILLALEGVALSR